MEPVLLLIPNCKILDPLHWHGAFEGAGNMALVTARSLDVQEMSDGGRTMFWAEVVFPQSNPTIQQSIVKKLNPFPLCFLTDAMLPFRMVTTRERRYNFVNLTIKYVLK